MDYRRFLDQSKELVAPVVEQKLWLSDRRLQLDRVDGWWRVKVQGRKVEALRQATPEEVTPVLSALPVLRGPVIRVAEVWRLVAGGKESFPVELAPVAEEPPLFAPLRARRLNELVLWDELEWEGENEEAARRALEEGRGLADLKGASAALRAAFAFAVAQRSALNIPALPAELTRWVGEIADAGNADAALRALAAERAVHAARVRQIAAVPASPRRVPNLEARVEESLTGAGARLRSVRRVGEGQVEVRWQFRGTLFISIVEEAGLRVLDAGVCLAGSDRMVTLDSLPGVIREAMADDALVITRHEDD